MHKTRVLHTDMNENDFSEATSLFALDRRLPHAETLLEDFTPLDVCAIAMVHAEHGHRG